MDRVWIIIEHGYTSEGAYQGLFFTNKESAEEYRKTIPFNYDYEVIALELYSEHLV